MAKVLNEKNVRGMIDKILDYLEDRYKYKTRVRPSYENVYELVTNLNELFNVYSLQNINEASPLCRKRFIPFLKMIITIDNFYERLVEYQVMLKNAYRIAAARDLECFIVYYEWELPENEKFYLPRIEILSGFIYYLNRMIFDPEFEGIIANLPSGWGKTYAVDLATAFSYGVDDTGTIIALCSNEDVVNGGSRTVKEIMQSEEFGEVFPNLKYSKEDKDYYKKDSESEWRLKNCKLSASYYAKTIRSNVVGCRASKWIWLDDLYADYKEALREEDNKFYFQKFVSVWRARFVRGTKVWKFIITGTMWSPTDFLVKTINWLDTDYTFSPHPKFKYTRVADNGKFAIIQVPALDVETNKSTCEALASTKSLLKDRASLDSYIFECNYQQNPISPEAMAFDWKNLKLYREQLTNEYGATYAVIDGTRKSGKDFFSMPIFQPYMNDYALIDCIYTQSPTSKLVGKVVDMIVTHNIKILVIETNVDGGLKTVLLEKLKEISFDNGIQIIEKYNTVNKQTRIELERGVMIDRIFYPNQDLFPLNSDMGKFMTSFTMYNIEGNNVHDDACFEENTLIATPFGNKKIKDIKVGDKVITPFGIRKVTACGITGYKKTIKKFGLNVTSNHKVYNKVANRFIPISQIEDDRCLCKLSLKNYLDLKAKCHLFRANSRKTFVEAISRSYHNYCLGLPIKYLPILQEIKSIFEYIIFKICCLKSKKVALINTDVKPVYNLTVENGGCYYANGILVSNCDSLAMFTAEIVAERSKPIKPIILARPF